MPDMKSEPYPWTYHVLLTRSGTLPCSPNSLPMVSKAISTHGSETSSQSTCGPKWSSFILSSCPGWSSSRQCSGPCSFSGFHLSDSLENPLYLFADESTLCRPICHPSDWQAAASLLSADLDKITNWYNTWNMSLTLTMSLRKHRLVTPPIYFLNNPLEEVLSFKLLGLTICHDLSWESHVSNLASKASRRLGILRRAKSFLGPPELLTTYHAFVALQY